MKQLLAGTILALMLAGCENPPSWMAPPPPKRVELPVAYRTTFDQADPATWKAIDAKTRNPVRAADDPTGEKSITWLMGQWWATEAGAWKIVREGGNGFLSLHRQSKFEPVMMLPGRRTGETEQKPPTPLQAPNNYILLPEIMATSFQLDVMVRSTSPKANFADVVIVMGYQNKLSYYYAHLCDQAGDTSHGIYVVDGDHRRPITKQRNAGITWGGKWHHVRVVRRWREGGAIMVYFDDMSAPVLTAADLRFDLGRIGLGSYNDLADFDSITLKAIAREADGTPRDQPPEGKSAAPRGAVQE